MQVRASQCDVDTPSGPMRTYAYAPVLEQGGQVPGLILYTEIFQQTEPMRRLAVQFASHGYLVMVPEIYHEFEPAGTVLGYEDAGKNKGIAYKTKKKLDHFDADAAAVVKALQADGLCNGRVGAVGFCIGGHLSFRAAFQPGVKAAACFYATDLHSKTLGEGNNADSLSPERLKSISGEMLMIWGRQDPHVPDDGRRLIYDALRQNKVHFTWHEFNAVHAYMRDEGDRYDPAVARLCFHLSLDLFQRKL
ncbi:MAG: dienelactone hydrolase family protein [Gemmataceae bacterium]